MPNLFPAFAGHEVVIHSPAHLRSIAELDRDQLRLVAHAWQARARAAMDSGFRYVHALVNEGRSAGSSLPHTHSQLIWLDAPPPGVVEEGEMDGVLDGEVVVERDGLVLVCPWVSRSPYEMRIAPSARAPDAFGDPLLALALELTACAVRRVRALQPGCPVNVWLHDGPWWHVHVVPRLTVPAGIELGAGIDVNPLPATEAGARLRAV